VFSVQQLTQGACEVITVVVVWAVTLYRLVGTDRYFEGLHCLHAAGQVILTTEDEHIIARRNVRKDSSSHSVLNPCALVHPYRDLAPCVSLLAISQYSEGLATDRLDTGFPRFPCVYKQMLRCFPTFQVATTYSSCSLPHINIISNQYNILYACKITTATG